MIQFSFNPKTCIGQIKGDYLQNIREHFSAKNEAAVFIKRFNRHYPDRSYVITPAGKVDPCLYFEIKKFLVQNQYVGDIELDEKFKRQIFPGKYNWNINAESLIPLSLPLRDYQEEVVKKCLNIGRGTVVLATAGGKTLIAASLLTNVLSLYPNDTLRCLYIVPDLGLVKQTCLDFISYNVPFTVETWSGGTGYIPAQVVIANTGILQSKNTSPDIFKDFNLLIVDEVHGSKKQNQINFIYKLVNTPHRFGFTGTLPENQLDVWNIIGKIGPVVYEKGSYDLRQEGYIADAEIQIIEIKYKTNPHAKGTNYNSIAERYNNEQKFLEKSEFRNNLICTLAQKVKFNSLILVNHIEHGQALHDILKLQNKQVYFIQGSVDVEEREKIRQLIAIRDDIIVIAISKIFSTGVNIPNLHYIIFAASGKAKIRTLQSIGRGLRLHKNKSKLVIIDIADKLKYGSLHLEKRISLYEKEKIRYALKHIQES